MGDREDLTQNRESLPGPAIARALKDDDDDCGWSLLNHGLADSMRLNLGNLNPIYERELTKLELHQGEGRWSVSKNGARGKGCRHK